MAKKLLGLLGFSPYSPLLISIAAYLRCMRTTQSWGPCCMILRCLWRPGAFGI